MENSEKSKKKPDTAATVTDSEQEDLVDIPADIVPQQTDIVKPVIPNVVKEACRAQIDYLKIFIVAEQAIIDKRAAEMKEIIEFLEENKEDVDG